MRPISNSQQGKLAEVYYRFKKVEEIIDSMRKHEKRLTHDFNQHMPKLFA